MDDSLIAGPALRDVRPDDDAAVRAVLFEQRALLETVRENAIWSWFGGVPNGFGDPRAQVRGVYSAFASVALFAVALVVAGFTTGLSLWITVGLAAASLVAWWVFTAPPQRRTLEFYGRAVQWPACVVGYEPEARDPDNEEQRCVVALVGTGVDGADALQRLLDEGRRWRQMFAGHEAPPASLTALVATARERLSREEHDGSRLPVPDASGLELAFLRVSPNLLTGGALTSRLLFVFADPDDRGAERTRVVQHSVWGPGAESLCEGLPLEEAA